MKMSNTWSYI